MTRNGRKLPLNTVSFSEPGEVCGKSGAIWFDKNSATRSCHLLTTYSFGRAAASLTGSRRTSSRLDSYDDLEPPLGTCWPEFLKGDYLGFSPAVRFLQQHTPTRPRCNRGGRRVPGVRPPRHIGTRQLRAGNCRACAKSILKRTCL